ncbi:MAG: hypothetical protein N3I35_15515 [Clostridia bacterium]|nr:hypothetical protein [Clostridia bacterium]
MYYGLNLISLDKLPRAMELQAVALNNRIYTLNGAYSCGFDMPNELYMYNPAAGYWCKKANLPYVKNTFSLVSLNAKIYVVGGNIKNNDVQSGSIEEYNPRTNTWIVKSEMPSPINSFGVTAINNSILIIGGYSKGCFTNEVYEYNPGNGKWSKKADWPQMDMCLSASVIDNKVYTISGNGIIDEYDYFADVWHTKSKLLENRHDFGCAVCDNQIYIFGGWASEKSSFKVEKILDSIELYDPNSNYQGIIGKLDELKWGMGTVSILNKIYVLGGCLTTFPQEMSFSDALSVYEINH